VDTVPYTMPHTIGCGRPEQGLALKSHLFYRSVPLTVNGRRLDAHGVFLLKDPGIGL